jgi:hypothetical protein
VKRGPGRPRGTGPKQIAARLAQARGETVPAEKNPVGRPPKQARVDRDAQSSAVRVDLGKVVC